MALQQLGHSSLRVSKLTVGCWSFGGDGDSYWGEQSQQAVDALVRAAIERDVNFFDTAFGYNDGQSEVSLGKALKGMRSRAVICNKLPIQPLETLSGFEGLIQGSLDRLATDYIDLMMFHWPLGEEALLRANLEAMMKARDRGMIREIGVSNFGVATLKIAKEMGISVAADEFCYNLMARGIEREILSYCLQSGVGVMAYMPLMQGILTGKYPDIASIPQMRRRTIQFSASANPLARHGGPGAEKEVQHLLEGLNAISKETGVKPGTLAVAWLCAKPGVASVIAGCRDEGQLHENADAVEVRLPADVVAKLDAASAPLMAAMGGDMDLWQRGANTRIW